ncbi:hypothetical protein BJ912DRAFT_1056166 [Pholiota molesta]|nr:hypothetical protein BJ912DRAFT_1056166 [Pholiota molesta]
MSFSLPNNLNLQQVDSKCCKNCVKQRSRITELEARVKRLEAHHQPTTSGIEDQEPPTLDIEDQDHKNELEEIHEVLKTKKRSKGMMAEFRHMKSTEKEQHQRIRRHDVYVARQQQRELRHPSKWRFQGQLEDMNKEDLRDIAYVLRESMKGTKEDIIFRIKGHFDMSPILPKSPAKSPPFSDSPAKSPPFSDLPAKSPAKSSAATGTRCKYWLFRYVRFTLPTAIIDPFKARAQWQWIWRVGLERKTHAGDLQGAPFCLPIAHSLTHPSLLSSTTTPNDYPRLLICCRYCPTTAAFVKHEAIWEKRWKALGIDADPAMKKVLDVLEQVNDRAVVSRTAGPPIIPVDDEFGDFTAADI